MPTNPHTPPFAFGRGENGDTSKSSDALPNKAAHQKPVIDKVYGYKFGSKQVLALTHENGVPLVRYQDYHGEQHTEALTLFNRWALRNKIKVP